MSVPKPPITYIGTHGVNIWQGKGQKKLAIVCHIMAGTLAGCDTWFSNPQAQASANYGIGKDGTIHCYVDPSGKDAPFANGLINQPDANVQALLAQTGNTNPNYWTVSIEHEGDSGDALPDAQFKASTQLCAWLCETFGILADDAHLLGHYEFDNITRHNCPGWNTATWNRYEAAVQALMQQVPAPPVDPCAALQARVADLQSQLAMMTADRDHWKAMVFAGQTALSTLDLAINNLKAALA